VATTTLITIPAGGGHDPGYNAVYGPDNGSARLVPASTRAAGTSATTTASAPPRAGRALQRQHPVLLHEEDGATSGTPQVQHLEYTLFRVNSYFIRGSDTKLDSSRCCPSTPPTGMPTRCSTPRCTTPSGPRSPRPMTRRATDQHLDLPQLDRRRDLQRRRRRRHRPLVGRLWAPAPRYRLPGGTYRLRVAQHRQHRRQRFRGAPRRQPGLGHKGYAVRVLDTSEPPAQPARSGPGAT